MPQAGHIVHSIEPIFDGRSRVLVLGTMHSPRSRAEGIFYGNPRNRFWPALAAAAGEPVPATNGRKRDFCLRHHLALWDVVAECDIVGASDASIANAVPNDLARILDAAPIEAVFCTGTKAHQLYRRLCEAAAGMPAAKLPSPSPANAACSLEELVAAYAPVLARAHPFAPPVLDVPQVVALERAVAQAGTPLSELMDRAGEALAWHALRLLEKREAGGARPPRGREAAPLAVVLCGNGNNGGDGWVAARHLAAAGLRVAVLAAKEPAAITAQPAHDAAAAAVAELGSRGGRVVRAAALADALDLGKPAAGAGRAGLPAGPLVVVDDAPDDPVARAAVAQLITGADLLVDAILGTGAAFAPRPPFSRWVEAAGRTRAAHLTVAADIPSGVDARTGEAYEPHVRADATVTMLAPKPGLDNPACGAVAVAPIAYIEPFL